MIVEPTPMNPRTPVRRALRLVGVALPPLLLLAVAGVGILGPRPEPTPTPPPAARAATAPATPTVTTAAATPAPGPTSPPPVVLAAQVPATFPESFDAIKAIKPSAAIAGRARGAMRGVVVLAGYLKIWAPDGTCAGDSSGPLGPWCRRAGIIADRAWAVPGFDFEPLPAHIHVVVPVGVRLPAGVESMATAIAGLPLPVIAVGRFTATGCAPEDLAWCVEPFTVDRFAWADGTRVGLTPLADERMTIDRRPPNPFSTAIKPWQTPLLAALVWPASVEALDPAAATAAAAGPASEPVWYVRVIVRSDKGLIAHGGHPLVRWMLLDDRRLTVIATGTPAAAPMTTTAASQ